MGRVAWAGRGVLDSGSILSKNCVIGETGRIRSPYLWRRKAYIRVSYEFAYQKL